MARGISISQLLSNIEQIGDILLADVLTSYAKVMGDLFVSGYMFLSSDISSTDKPDRSCGGAYMVLLIISISSMIRLRQCLIEYMRVRNNPNKNANTGWGNHPPPNQIQPPPPPTPTTPAPHPPSSSPGISSSETVLPSCESRSRCSNPMIRMHWKHTAIAWAALSWRRLCFWIMRMLRRR